MLKNCDLCEAKNLSSYVDGATKTGPWANMCLNCYNEYGVGIGIGKGQMYVAAGDKYIKIAG